MLDHHIQRRIVYTLAFADEMRFGELQPDDLDNKLFDYHLKKVIAEGYVVKNEDGLYSLTPEGRRVGKGALTNASRMINRAYSLLFMVVRRQSDGAWLLFKRGTQPLLGLTGFMQAQPSQTLSAIEVAHQVCLEKTDLDGEFRVASNGYFRIFKDEELESFSHFTLLVCDDVSGELAQNDTLGEYYWQFDPDFTIEGMLPTAKTLSELSTTPLPFVEQTFRI
jgi:hypothetical protein